MMHTWWTIYNNALARGEEQVYAEYLADEWAKRQGREGENPINPGAPLVLCNARDRCGIADCPHAVEHARYDDTCDGGSCVRWAMAVLGVGKKRAMCRCEEVEG